MYAEIRERRTAPDLAERTDVLSRLIRVRARTGDALSDTELRDQLVTLLLAGHETTATALAWALYELGRDPAQLRRCAGGRGERRRRLARRGGQGVDAAAPGDPDGGADPDEAPATIGGYDLPAGTTVGPSILIAHRARGQPRRPGAVRPGAVPRPATRPRNTWIPFGGGVRRCIGAGFALMEGVAVLREVFTAYDVEAVGHDEPQVRNITSVPHRGARIRVRPARDGGWSPSPATGKPVRGHVSVGHHDDS